MTSYRNYNNDSDYSDDEGDEYSYKNYNSMNEADIRNSRIIDDWNEPDAHKFVSGSARNKLTKNIQRAPAPKAIVPKELTFCEIMPWMRKAIPAVKREIAFEMAKEEVELKVVEVAPTVAEVPQTIAEVTPKEKFAPTVAKIAPIVAEVPQTVAKIAPTVVELPQTVIELPQTIAEVAPKEKFAPTVAKIAPIVAEVAQTMAKIAPTMVELPQTVADVAPKEKYAPTVAKMPEEKAEISQSPNEIAQLISLMTNVVYSDKETFLRELISNSSDALDKIRYESLTDASKLESGKELFIKIIPNKEARTLTLIDTGIGMNMSDLVNNLGKIARPGTKAFMEAVTAGADISMIGQFGVGFYSAYLVADKVTVHSKCNDYGQYVWESSADGSSTIKVDKGEPMGRGTKIVLHIKEDQTEFLEEAKIKSIVNKYCQIIAYPIKLMVERVEIIKVVKVVKGKNKNKNKKKKYMEEEQLNQEPLWSRKPEEISAEEYDNFFKSLTISCENHLGVKHFMSKGLEDFIGLLYISRQFETEKKIKLFMSGVFITDNCDGLIPDYLNFVGGVIEVKEVPTNISLEMLRKDEKSLDAICGYMSSILVQKIFELLDDLTKDKENYQKFYNQFSKNLKIGVLQDSTNRDKLTDLLRFQTSASGDELCSLEEYVGRMKETQKDIYFIDVENKDSAFMECFKKRDFEIIYLTEPNDKHVIEQLKKYLDLKLVCVSEESMEFSKSEEEDDKEKIETISFSVDSDSDSGSDSDDEVQEVYHINLMSDIYSESEPDEVVINFAPNVSIGKPSMIMDSASSDSGLSEKAEKKSQDASTQTDAIVQTMCTCMCHAPGTPVQDDKAPEAPIETPVPAKVATIPVEASFKSQLNCEAVEFVPFSRRLTVEPDVPVVPVRVNFPYAPRRRYVNQNRPYYQNNHRQRQ